MVTRFFFAIVFSTTFLFAQTPVQISGFVKDRYTNAGAGVGVNIYLANNKTIKATIYGNGSFTLTGTIPITPVNPVSVTQKNSPLIKFNQGEILFNNEFSGHVKIGIYDVSGKQVYGFDKIAPSGVIRATPGILAQGMYALRIKTETEKINIAFLSINNKITSFFKTPNGMIKSENHSFAKTAAVLDTLICQKASYANIKIKVTNYTTSGLNLYLDSLTSIPVTWTDRRVIMAWMWGAEAGGPVEDSTVKGGSQALFGWAKAAIGYATTNNAQGVVLWDIEGWQNDGGKVMPASFNYVGDPRLLGQLNPVVNANIDSIVKLTKAAGLKFGVGLRVQKADVASRSQDYYPDATTRNIDMIAKVRYAVNRWDAKLYYVDTNNRNDVSEIRALRNAFPNCLFIPEHTYDDPESWPALWRENPFLCVSAPLTYVDHVDITINKLPGGLACIYLDPTATAARIQANMPAIVAAVRAGAIIGPVSGSWYPSEQLSMVPIIKKNAGVQ